MVLFVGILGALQIIGGIAVYFVAKSPVHEILGAVMFGMGVLAFGLGCMMERADRQVDLLESIKSRI